jgi:hypothetical protein
MGPGLPSVSCWPCWRHQPGEGVFEAGIADEPVEAGGRCPVAQPDQGGDAHHLVPGRSDGVGIDVDAVAGECPVVPAGERLKPGSSARHGAQAACQKSSSTSPPRLIAWFTWPAGRTGKPASAASPLSSPPSQDGPSIRLECQAGFWR